MLEYMQLLLELVSFVVRPRVGTQTRYFSVETSDGRKGRSFASFSGGKSSQLTEGAAILDPFFHIRAIERTVYKAVR